MLLLWLTTTTARLSISAFVVFRILNIDLMTFVRSANRGNCFSFSMRNIIISLHLKITSFISNRFFMHLSRLIFCCCCCWCCCWNQISELKSIWKLPYLLILQRERKKNCFGHSAVLVIIVSYFKPKHVSLLLIHQKHANECVYKIDIATFQHWHLLQKALPV